MRYITNLMTVFNHKNPQKRNLHCFNHKSPQKRNLHKKKVLTLKILTTEIYNVFPHKNPH